VEEVLDTCDDEQGCLLVLLVLLIDFQKIFISFFSKDGNRAQAFHQAFAARRLRTCTLLPLAGRAVWGQE
jgi:hypothetical protein